MAACYARVMTQTTEARWFEEILDQDAVAHYVSDTVSEVYAMRADADRYARVREDDGVYYVTVLTNDRAELIVSEATLSGLSESMVAAVILTTLGA
jgi:hypothetical protein